MRREELELEVLRLLRNMERLLRKLVNDEAEDLNRIERFAAIKQESPTMVPLAAGQTATFSTTPIPPTSVPNPAALPVWSSSDMTNAPVSPNTADASGLSTLVVFPSGVAAGVTFSLTITYTNADGTIATQTNSFVTVAPPSPDITGFTPIVQTA